MDTTSTAAQVSSHEKYTPALIKAILDNDLQKVQSLLEEGADPNECNSEEYTPLWVAVKEGNIEIVKVLSEAEGIDVNQIVFSEKELIIINAPLILAVSQQDFGIVRQLILQGANPNQTNSENTTPQKLASLKKNQRVLDALNSTPSLKVPMPEKSLDTLFQMLKKPEEYEAIYIKAELEKLVKNNKKLTSLLNTYDAHGNLPLYWAIKHDLKNKEESFPCAHLLIQFGATVDIFNRQGKTLLYQIIRNTGSLLAVELLLREDAQPLTANEDLNNPFHAAASRKDPEMIKALGNVLLAKNEKESGEQFLTEEEIAQINNENYERVKPSSLAQYDTKTATALRNLLSKRSHTLHSIPEASEAEAPTTDDGEVTLYSPPSWRP